MVKMKKDILADLGKNDDLLVDLRRQNTLVFVLLCFITLGIYAAHYIKAQTEVINDYVSENNGISQTLVTVILVTSYLYVGLSILEWTYFKSSMGDYATVQPSKQIGLTVVKIGNMLLWMVASLMWCFQARGRIHRVCGIKPEDDNWFGGFWTTVFWYFYLNRKVNKVSEALIYARL